MRMGAHAYTTSHFGVMARRSGRLMLGILLLLTLINISLPSLDDRGRFRGGIIMTRPGSSPYQVYIHYGCVYCSLIHKIIGKLEKEREQTKKKKGFTTNHRIRTYEL